MMNSSSVVSSTLRNDDERKLLMTKILAMLVLGITSFGVGVLPLKLAKYVNLKSENPQKNNLMISLMLCFGGGVLLFTTFLHLQPEVRESFAKLQAANQIPSLGLGIPIAELVFCSGFFFVYFIEEVIHMLLEKRANQNEADEVLQRSISLRRCSKAHLEACRFSVVALNKTEEIPVNLNNGFASCPTNRLKPDGKSKHNHVHVDSEMKNSFRGLLAVLALSFHAIFEGLAVGLENNSTNVWYLFAAIATHKLVIAFCVGVELLTSNTKKVLMFLYLGTFAMVTPIGIAIGIVLSETSDAKGEVVVATILQGMAAGTLLYVVFFEVLAREKNNDHDGIWQLTAIILGFVTMVALQYLTGEHSHGHDSTGATAEHGHHHH